MYNAYGINGDVLDWFSSYLTGRIQSVVIEERSEYSYADDTQLYLTMDHSNNNWDGVARIQLCVSEIREWMNQNMLKLNNDKTKLIVFTSKYKQDLYNDLSITIGDTVVNCSSQIRDLGVIFDLV